ncbi:MAG: hypothetical protein EHM91_17770 [Planctomycetota bacterium]|nr:MAG: hypothetical protein EHM91_17770 [Planctomycetota bacterium]
MVDGFTVRGKGGLSAADAGTALAAAKGGVSCKSGSADELRSDVLFGWNPDEGDDERFWSDELEVLITDKPCTYADPESEIPGREARLSIAFGGNKGWWPPEDLRSTFRDEAFLLDLEEVLGLPVVLVTISS